MAGSFVQVDDWIRAAEGEPPPAHRAVLGFEVRESVDLVDILRDDIDKVVRRHKSRDGKGRAYPGRRRAMMADRELADRAHQLCRDRTVGQVLAGLGMSRQALLDVWAAHQMTPPGGTKVRTP